MIKVTNNIDDISRLWSEAFGDSREDIEFFYNNLSNGKCIAYYFGERIASMLYLISCTVDGEDSKYVYAACTTYDLRGNGYMSSLLDYVKDNYKNVCLIPANEGLIDFYKKRGLTFEKDINSISFEESKSITDEYLFEGCELEHPILLSTRE